MKLITTRTSPYGRKVRIVLAEKRMDYDLVIEVPSKAGPRIAIYNPLGQIPVLVLDGGITLFDSRVIVEYLDNVDQSCRLIPEDPLQRANVRRWEALAEGCTEAAATVRGSKVLPPDKQNVDAIARKQGKLDRALRAISEGLAGNAWCCGDTYSLADIVVGCTLGYFDWRVKEVDWRKVYPNLGNLYDKLSVRESFRTTASPGGDEPS